MSECNIFSKEWFDKYKLIINYDQELSWVAKHMTCSFLWQIENEQILFDVNKGKIVSIRYPNWNDSWHFSIEGPKNVWEVFIQKYPPPLYNSLLGLLTKHPDCALKGSRMIAMQNIRAIIRIFSLARYVPVP